MKFGKRMRSLASSAWTQHYVDYKQLKKIIKTTPSTSAFWQLLQAEMDKVNGAHAAIAQELQSTRLQPLQEALGDRWVLSPAKARSLLLDGIQLCHDIDAFRRFVVLNSLAMVKITKKFDKATGSDLKTQMLDALKQQPFYDGTQLNAICTQAIALVDRIMMCVLPDGNYRLDPEFRHHCPICLSASIQSPITLSCAHTFCWSCLSTAAEHRFNACPLCRKQQSIDPRDYEIDGLLKRFKRVYRFVQKQLDRAPLASSRMHPIIVEAFALVNTHLQQVHAQYAALTPRTSSSDLSSIENQFQQDKQKPVEPVECADPLPEPSPCSDPAPEFVKGDVVEILCAHDQLWYPGMIMQCNDDSTYAVLWWKQNNSQRFGQRIPHAQLRAPMLYDAHSSFMLFDFAAGAWKTAAEWALTPFRTLRSLSVLSDELASLQTDSECQDADMASLSLYVP